MDSRATSRSPSSIRQPGLGLGQRGLGGGLGFPGGDVGRVGFQLGVGHLVGGVVGERVETVIGHVVLEHKARLRRAGLPRPGTVARSATAPIDTYS